MRTCWNLIRLAARHHFWGSVAALAFTVIVIATQITDRGGFANAALHRDVMDRWGTPIVQPAPSVRYVEAGTVFNTLDPLPLARQLVDVDVAMNYRKRGLVYFSGFDFSLTGRYEVENRNDRAIEAVFVFPLDVERNRVLLSDLSFRVDGQPETLALDARDRLVWTGPIAAGASRQFEIAFRGRGLESFTYQLDPALPVRNLELTVRVAGGEGYDYADGVVPATSADVGGDGWTLEWTFASLESGVPLGVILPSERSFDALIHTMLRRALLPFGLWFAALALLSVSYRRALRIEETYLLSATFSFFYVLLPYLAAYVHFYVAYGVSVAAIVAMLVRYQHSLFGRRAVRPALGLAAAFLVLPTAAVVVETHTGLIYTLAIAAGLLVAMRFTAETWFSDALTTLTKPLQTGSFDQPEEA